MRIHSVIEQSKVNGPGIRYTIWFQGCSIHCPDCANKQMWDHKEGYSKSPQDLIADIKKVKVDGVSLTGGEPLDQYKELVIFLKLCKKNDIAVFLTSGHYLSEIKEIYPKILTLVDILIDGPFIKDKLDTSPLWRGSTNQGINLLSEKAQKYQGYIPEYTTEIIFHPDGKGVITGFNIPEFLERKSK